MKIIGVTGGVGSGKSAVLSYLETYQGVQVLLADKVGHILMEKGQPCYEAVRHLFGDEVLNQDGELSRPAIAAIVYSDADKLQALNHIVHPQVRIYIENAIKKAREEGIRLFVLEAALLLEEHYDEICDEVWYIYADEEVRLQRLASSRGYTEERSRSIMAKQLSEEYFRKHCHVTIDNSGDLSVTEKIIRDRLISNGIVQHS